MKEFWTSLASLLGVFAFCQSLLHSVFPPELRLASMKFFNRIFHWFSTYCYFDITEIDGVNTNELYNAVQLYLSSSASITGNRLSLTRALNSSSFTFGLSNNDSIIDTFNGITAYWEHIVTQRQSQGFSWRPLPEEKRGFSLRIKKKDKTLILNSYLDHIINKAAEIRRKNQDRLLYTNSGGGSIDSRGSANPWESVSFKHPSTFETLAMDPEKKNELMEDLLGFSDGEAFYKQTGRAWKRGYLLYGPPGTGKSSMIAAMANFLGYDIYDLELTQVNNNSELRKLLMKTTSKSIIVIEDIDCSINLTNRNAPKQEKKQVPSSSQIEPEKPEEGGNSITLSGLLNFTDGLWSCCGSERIFVFTTNHIEKLDPALLRSGRMDMHIHMSFCSFESLKILLKNYLGLNEDDEVFENGLLREMGEVIDEAEITPADISEVLIKNRRNKEKALKELLKELKKRAEKKKKKESGMVVKEEKKKKKSSSMEEEEKEEEKRELEMVKEDCEELLEENCSNSDFSVKLIRG